MRNVTSSFVATARLARESGQGMWMIPLEKIEELATYLQKVDRLVIAAESLLKDMDWCAVDPVDRGYPAKGKQALREALREVQS